MEFSEKLVTLRRRAGLSQEQLVDRLEQKLDALAGDYRRSWGPYFQYTSKTRILGLPMVSVRFGRDRHPSENTLAVGVCAAGAAAVKII